MGNAGWLYCTLCERAFQATSKMSCIFDCCDGEFGDIWEWESVRELNQGYPEIPTLGEEYALFGDNPLKNLRRYHQNGSAVHAG